MKYDLEERTAKFAEEVILIMKNMQKNVIIIPLIGQLIRSASAIGANYQEANGASSKKDFRNKIFICKKEAKETQYWLRLLVQATEQGEEYKHVRQEVQELILIFSKIARNSK